VAFIAAAAMATIILIGAMGMVWYTVKGVLGGLVHGINFAWDRWFTTPDKWKFRPNSSRRFPLARVATRG
jgi:hypothetical protein